MAILGLRPAVHIIPLRPTVGGASGVGASVPAVHIIPLRRDFDGVLVVFNRMPAVHIIPLRPVNASPTNGFNKFACCPHYPLKTPCAVTVSAKRRRPAVHIIPLRHARSGDAVVQYIACCPHYPLKTPKRTNSSSPHRDACCPHYPLKTRRPERSHHSSVGSLLSTLSP